MSVGNLLLYKILGLEQCPLDFQVPPSFFKECLSYIPDPTDLFVVSYPKCGTTWTMMICWLIKNDLIPPAKTDQLQISPFFEMYLGVEGISKLEKPRQLKSHLPFDLMPYNSDTKYIYVVRNPFDCCVSFYKHHTGYVKYKYDRPFDEYFELFLRGDMEYGDYFRHAMSWYAHKDDPNILFIIYEEMKRNPEKTVKDIGNFLGGIYADRVSKDDFVHKAVALSSFESMKEWDSEIEKQHVNVHRKNRFNFFREGKVGDYKNYFNDMQLERMTEKLNSYMKGTNLIEIWKDI